MPQDPTLQNFDDLRQALGRLPGPDAEAEAAARTREPQLTKPPGSLGRLEELSLWLASWQGNHPPRMGTPRALVFAGNHGVTAQGVSAYPSGVTAQMVANFDAGGAAVKQLCRTCGVELSVEALTLERPVADFTVEPAMSEEECLDAVVSGIAAVRENTDVLCLGEMGIGNTTSAAALSLALYGGNAADWTGPGAGIAGPALARKTETVAVGVARHRETIDDGLDALRHFGGRELAAIAGAVVAARYLRVPILLDGFVATAAAAALEATRTGSLDHCQVAHVSTEPGHRRLLDRLNKVPLLDLGMRLGEASGAVLAVAVLRAAAQCHAGMATFEEAGVSGKSDC